MKIIEILKAIFSFCGNALFMAAVFGATTLGVLQLGKYRHSEPVGETPALAVTTPTTAKLKHIKLVVVNSYNYKHICTRPQVLGFVSKLDKYEETHKVEFNILSFYMRSKLVNTTRYLMKQQAKLIIRHIHEYQPDYIYITDDNAYRYVGLKLIQEHYHVYFSGINYPFTYYKMILNDPSLLQYTSGVEETIRLHKLFLAVNQSSVSPTCAYLIIDNQNKASATNKAVLRTIIHQLKQNNIPYELYPVTTVYQLKEVLQRLNNKDLGYMFIIVQRVFDNAKNIYIDLQRICRIVAKENTKQIEVTFNPEFVRTTHVALSVAPNFYDMGKKTADIMLTQIDDGDFSNIVVPAKCDLVCSYDRLKQLHLEDIYLNNSRLFDNVY